MKTVEGRVNSIDGDAVQLNENRRWFTDLEIPDDLELAHRVRITCTGPVTGKNKAEKIKQLIGSATRLQKQVRPSEG